MKFKEIDNYVFVRSDSENICFTKFDNIEVNGKIYSHESRDIERINYYQDYLNQKDKLNKLNWHERIIDDLIPFFNIKAICHLPGVEGRLGYYGCYSDNEYVDVLMTLLNENIKIEGCTFYSGKNETGIIEDAFNYYFLKRNVVCFYIYTYGWNCSIMGEIKIKNLFDYNYQEIIKRCYFNEHIYRFMKEYLKDDKIKEPIEINLNKMAIELFNYKIKTAV